eukprot:Awhi_evm2s12079
MSPNLPENCYPIFPFPSYRNPEIKLENGLTQTVKIKQFPITPSTACTIYKVQGVTSKRLVCLDWKSKYDVVNKRENGYLIVSRVTNRNDFLTIFPLTKHLCDSFQPTKACKLDDDRLRNLGARTLHRLHTTYTYDLK